MLGIFAQGCKKEKIEKDDKVEPSDFLSASDFEELIVEVQYVSGYAPSSTTISNLKSFLEQRLNKPGGITISQSAIASPGKPVLTLEDIKEIETENRSQHTNRKTLTAYFFFADGEYAENQGSSKVLGIAYGNSSMVIFEKTVQDFSGGLSQPPRSALESTVVQHEFGHILGLVNNGTPMSTAHQDTQNGHHCNNSNCLMYYTAETSDIIANILGGNIPSLDAKCIADLQVNGGK
jgi:hypothetical protein